jgi:transcriptional regulator with XRE-family HTH domain
MEQEREALKKRLKSKEHRDAFVSAYVDQTIPFQIRALRLSKQRNWTQEQLATEAGMKQERISALENPNYGQFSLKTLKQLASAFGVALIVRFASFGELAEWEINLSSESLEVPSFNQDPYFQEKEGPTTITTDQKYTKISSDALSGEVPTKACLSRRAGLSLTENIPMLAASGS